jgi:hypothetical protein
MDKADISMRSMYEFGDRLAAPSASEIDELVDRSQTLEQRIQSLNDSYETLKKREMELTEWRWVLREAGGFFDRVSLKHMQEFGYDTNTSYRLVDRPTRSVNPSTRTTTTMHPYSLIWSRLRTAMPQASALSLS